MKQLNAELRPPNGFRFTDEDQVTHVGNDFESLVANLMRYRKRVGRPEGNPRREIMEQICSKCPRCCRDVANTGPFQGKALASAVVAEIARAKLNNVKFGAPEDVVAARIKACLGCSACVDWAKHCPPCQEKNKKILPALTQPEKPVAELKGQACLFARDDLSVAVRLSEPTELPGAPPECWRKAK